MAGTSCCLGLLYAADIADANKRNGIGKAAGVITMPMKSPKPGETCTKIQWMTSYFYSAAARKREIGMKKLFSEHGKKFAFL